MFPNAPAAINFSIRCGATFRQVLTWTTGGEGGTPIDFTGYSGEMVVWDDEGEQVLDGTGSPGVELTSEGLMTLTISDADTAEVPPTCGSYRVTLTDSLGRVSDWLKGSFGFTEQPR